PERRRRFAGSDSMPFGPAPAPPATLEAPCNVLGGYAELGATFSGQSLPSRAASARDERPTPSIPPFTWTETSDDCDDRLSEPDERVRPAQGRRRLELQGRGRRSARLSRPERGRQDDHDADHRRLSATDVGARSRVRLRRRVPADRGETPDRLSAGR